MKLPLARSLSQSRADRLIDGVASLEAVEVRGGRSGGGDKTEAMGLGASRSQHNVMGVRGVIILIRDLESVWSKRVAGDKTIHPKAGLLALGKAEMLGTCQWGPCLDHRKRR